MKSRTKGDRRLRLPPREAVAQTTPNIKLKGEIVVTKSKVAEIARRVVQQRLGCRWGLMHVSVGHTKFYSGPVYGPDGKAKGYCARFVRQVHEAALGLGEFEWPYRAANARQMEGNLKRAGLQVDAPQSGDIVCFNKGGGKYGHIGIWLGNGEIAENTSSTRGNPREPGTKITVLTAKFRKRVSGYYAPMPSAIETTTIKMIKHGEGVVVGELDLVANGDHIADQGKLYVAGLRVIS